MSPMALFHHSPRCSDLVCFLRVFCRVEKCPTLLNTTITLSDASNRSELWRLNSSGNYGHVGVRHFNPRSTTIAFRRWGVAGSAGDPTLILIHGSALSSTSLHLLGKALAAAGIAVYAPDIRGHGNTGRKGGGFGSHSNTVTPIIVHRAAWGPWAESGRPV